MSSVNPFKGRAPDPVPAMRVLHRFIKAGRWVEIRERKVTQFAALEFFVFMDGSLLESQMFHGGREHDYPAALAAVIAQYVDGGWIEQPTVQPAS